MCIRDRYIGDGNIFINQRKGVYRITFYLNPKKELQIGEKIFSLLKKLNLNPFKYISANRSLKIEAYSKNLIQWISSIATKDGIRNINSFTDEMLQGIIEGLIDSDGCVEKKRFNISTSNPKLVLNVEKILNTLNISHSIILRIRKNTSHSREWIIRFSRRYSFIKPLKVVLPQTVGPYTS